MLPLPPSGLPLPSVSMTLPLPKPSPLMGNLPLPNSGARLVRVLGVEDMPNYRKLKLWPLAEQEATKEGLLLGLSPGRRVIAIGARLERLWADLNNRKPLPLPTR